MLRISKKAGYGVEVLVALSEVKGGELISIKQISKDKKLPLSFLSQVMSKLKKANLVISKEGLNGGYKLSLKPAEISLLKIIQVFEGDPVLVECLGKDEVTCARKSCCTVKDSWLKLSCELRTFFENKTLKDMIDKSK